VSAYADFDIEKKEIQTAIKEILQKEGLATKEDAERFWKRIPKNTEAEKAIEQFADKLTSPAKNLQYQMWLCVKKAWIEKKENNCPIAKKLQIKFGKEYNFDTTSNILKLSLLIQSAAKNQSYLKIENIEYNLSLEAINETIKGIDQKMENLKYVLKNKQ
jgi:hypothetical protein